MLKKSMSKNQFSAKKKYFSKELIISFNWLFDISSLKGLTWEKV